MHPLSPHNESERSEKKFEKSFKKIWWFEKKVLPLHHFPLRKSGQTKRGLRASQNRKCSYRNIRTTFFEVIEQQSFYPLERVISNNTFEIRAKDLTKHFFTMESLILAQDER